MKKSTPFLLFIFLFIAYQTTSAQNAQGCDGVRYYYDVYQDISKTLEQYGSNETAGGATVNLRMDVFEPVGDNLEKRPLMIWAHGGAFAAGERSEMDSLCYLFAKKGFVTASMSYRLYPVIQLGIPDSIGMLDAAMKAVGDMKAVVRHFRKDAATENKFRIDPDFIYVGGVSAGAIMAVQVAYLDSLDNLPDYFTDILDANGGIEGDTGDDENQSYSSGVNGVINLAGAIHKLEWIKEGDVPIISYHGDEDDVVPYGHGLSNVFGFNFMSLNGSGSIHNYVEPLGIPNFLVTAPGANHETAFNSGYSEYLETFIAEGQLFLYELLCSGIAINVKEVSDGKELKAFPNPSNDIATLDLSALNGAYDISVYDLAGRLVFSDLQLFDNRYSLEKNRIGAGLFFVQIQTKEERYISKVIFE